VTALELAKAEAVKMQDAGKVMYYKKSFKIPK
jgi:hypothetical protein